MARFLEILTRLRKFITKEKENSVDPAANPFERIIFCVFGDFREWREAATRVQRKS